MFFHEAADSEELCEEALRCQASIVSSDLYPASLASFQQAMQTLSGWLRSSAVAVWMHAYLYSPRRTVPCGAESARCPQARPGQHLESSEPQHLRRLGSVSGALKEWSECVCTSCAGGVAKFKLLLDLRPCTVTSIRYDWFGLRSEFRTPSQREKPETLTCSKDGKDSRPTTQCAQEVFARDEETTDAIVTMQQIGNF